MGQRGAIGICIYFCLSSLCVAQPNVLRVAVYADSGAGDAGPKNIELTLADTQKYSVQRIMAGDIRKGTLQFFDVLIQPGGRGSYQAKQLGEEGCDSIRQFVARGGGYVGICAGAYLASSFYPWSLNLLNAYVMDREHWNRGNGKVMLAWTREGREFFGFDDKETEVQYNQGPLLVPGENDKLPPYTELARYNTEIAENGAPFGVMLGKTAIAIGKYQNGRAAAISPHPEKSEGLRKLVEQLILWSAAR
jgi:putative intracellular protease/amidase